MTDRELLRRWLDAWNTRGDYPIEETERALAFEPSDPQDSRNRHWPHD